MIQKFFYAGCALITSACAINPPIDTTVDRSVAVAPVHVEQQRTPQKPANIALEQRLALPAPSDHKPEAASEHLYSFVAQNLPVQRALEIFRQAYGVNIIADADVSGTLSADFRDLPFDQAMEAMLDSVGLYWSREGELIRVRSRVTKNFVIDYIRLVRSGSGTTLAQINSGQSGGGDSGGGEGGGDNGAITIEQNDTVEFWAELEDQIASLTSSTGRLVINRMAGTVQVTDAYPRVQEIESYIREINHAIHRQVDIDVRIVEVSLSDDFSLGVDWSRIAAADSEGLNFGGTTNNTIGQPAGGFIAKTPSIAADVFSVNAGALDFAAMVDALREQGTVRVVSQPQVRVLNNQSAMIKVGTDRTFFRREVTTNNTSAGSTLEAEDVPQVVTEGIVLSLTPQIATNGWIMLDVSPVITRVSSVSLAVDGNGTVRSSAPNLDIRQASSLVRVQNGETIVIGGLIQDEESDTERGIPLLSDIPGIGELFKGRYELRGKKELVMFLTARLVDSHEIAAR